MKKSLFSIIITVAFLSFTMLSCQKQKPEIMKTLLLTSGWTFRQAGEQEWMPAKVPGTVHTDLFRQGKIKDPFYRMNEHDQQWIDKKDWEYKTTFQVGRNMLHQDKIELLFEGLDTYADVYLNDTLIKSTNNMFREWRIDCKALLNPGDNELRIYFHSPTKIGVRKHDSLDYHFPDPPNDFSEIGGLGEKKVSIFTRKAGYHYGWDWGPRFVTSGIWRPVSLNSWSQVKIRDMFIKQKSLSDSLAVLSALIETEATEDVKGKIRFYINNALYSAEEIELKKGNGTISYELKIENPQLWWPQGLGDQNLYSVRADLITEDFYETEKETRIGLRTIEVVQEEDDKGKSFYLQVNGRPVFMKGANYIPQDNFLNRVTPERYESLIKSAVDANMNMLRVWGGGVYEKDIFYDLCDENGILVWQDFMFACSMYPGDDEFLANVKQEAIDNVRRLRNHPSIALWCGNNECIDAWYHWGWKDKTIEEQGQEVADIIWKAYDDLFHHILFDVVKTYDPDRFYWPSSPGEEFGKPSGGNSGDLHYWGVWWGKEPFSSYAEVIPRFMSEYGFQSFPEFKTIKEFSVEEDQDVYSEVMKSHQRSSIGNETIEEYMLRDFRKPKDFRSFLYVNHVLQAEGTKIAMEAHRRNMPYCMGSLYWQINDCWPAASWSGRDYYGRWKAMHYYVKKAYKDILVSVDSTDTEIGIFVISDKTEDLQATLKASVISFTGDITFENEKKITVLENKSKKYLTLSKNEILKDADKQQSLLLLQVEDNNGTVMSENIIYFVPFKALKLSSPEIQMNVEKMAAGYEIELSTDILAKNVYLETEEDGFFSDNYFDILPGQSAKIMFSCGKDMPNFEEKLQIRTLEDTYEMN